MIIIIQISMIELLTGGWEEHLHMAPVHDQSNKGVTRNTKTGSWSISRNHTSCGLPEKDSQMVNWEKCCGSFMRSNWMGWNICLMRYDRNKRPKLISRNIHKLLTITWRRIQAIFYNVILSNSFHLLAFILNSLWGCFAAVLGGFRCTFFHKRLETAKFD